MANQPSVSRGWSSFAANLTKAADQAIEQAAKDASQLADIGDTWTAMMTQVVATVPQSLTRARDHASRMLGTVR